MRKTLKIFRIVNILSESNRFLLLFLVGCWSAIMAQYTFSENATQIEWTINQGAVKIYISPDEDAATFKALESLKKDVLKITGSSAQIIFTNEMSDIPEKAIAILNSANAKLTIPYYCTSKVTGLESHRVYSINNKVYIHGSDIRGTIYAIYTFSEKILGVPPLWYWSSFVPLINPVLVIPSNLDIYFPTPQVRYRAWFPNDTDMFVPWRAQSEENNVAWLETMLRLKLNTVEIGSTLNYLPSGNTLLINDANIIKSYGLIVSSTHTVALGINLNKWDDFWLNVKKRNTVPPFSVLDEAGLKEFWEHAATIVHQSGLENIWQISFRGDGDIPFWETFTDAPESNEERATIINKMWNIQYGIIQKVTNNPSPLIKITFYNEISDFMAAGLLTPPSTENMIWNYVSTRRDHYPNNDIVNFNSQNVKMGYYMNLQFTGTGSHLTQGEGPWKMEFNYRFVNSKSPLYYSVINVGNLREFLFSMSANAKMMWDINSYNTDEFLTEFCKTYYGAHAEIPKLYKDYFDSYWQQKTTDFSGMERQYIFQDLRFKQAIKVLCDNFSKSTYNANPLPVTEFRYYNIVPEDNNATNQIDAIINGMYLSKTKFETVSNTADRIYGELPVKCKNFFHDNLRSQSYFMKELSNSFYHLALSYKNNWGNKELASQHILLALSAAKNAKDYLHSNQHDVFSNWYQGDLDAGKFNIQDIINRIEKVKNTFTLVMLDKETLSTETPTFLYDITKDELRISYPFSSNYSVSVYNTLGQMLLKKMSKDCTVAINFNVTPGIYIIVLSDDQNKTIIKKINNL